MVSWRCNRYRMSSGVMRWLQLRFDYHSTAVRLLIKIIKGTQWRHPLAAVTQTLFNYLGCSAAAHSRLGYGRDVRRGIIVARLNGSRMGVESCCNRRLVASSEARLVAVHVTWCVSCVCWRRSIMLPTSTTGVLRPPVNGVSSGIHSPVTCNSDSRLTTLKQMTNTSVDGYDIGRSLL